MLSAGRATIASLVVDAADRAPDRPAVVAEQTWSYQVLADRVMRIAGALAARGVHAGDRVAILSPKSPEAVATIHAALCMGAIAMPLDPLSPADLVADIVADTDPAAVLLHPTTAAKWPTDSPAITMGATAVEPTVSDAEIAAARAMPPVRADPTDAAYLITTSGSTGRPKGIVHTHSSAHAYAELAVQCFGLNADDRMANVAPFHFDQSTFELYAGPMAGATVVLVPEVVLRFPASVAALVEHEAVTTWYSVPTILRQLVERGGLAARDLTALRWVLFGGEVFAPAALRRLMAMLPHARFTNVYGPAEVNQCTHHHLDAPPEDERAVPIGRPWARTEVRVVDGDTIVDGPGRGTLEVRTATAMAGYWGDPERSAGCWTGEPGEHGSRWYRTGDLVERDHDGTLWFLGRADRQAKVRGVRIELEAIEAAMDAIDGVTASAAVVSAGDEPCLVGLVESVAVDEQHVRRALASRLGPGMRPDRIVIVDSLPRTGSAKVDANAAAQLLATGADR